MFNKSYPTSDTNVAAVCRVGLDGEELRYKMFIPSSLFWFLAPVWLSLTPLLYSNKITTSNKLKKILFSAKKCWNEPLKLSFEPLPQTYFNLLFTFSTVSTEHDIKSRQIWWWDVWKIQINNYSKWNKTRRKQPTSTPYIYEPPYTRVEGGSFPEVSLTRTVSWHFQVKPLLKDSEVSLETPAKGPNTKNTHRKVSAVVLNTSETLTIRHERLPGLGLDLHWAGLRFCSKKELMTSREPEMPSRTPFKAPNFVRLAQPINVTPLSLIYWSKLLPIFLSSYENYFLPHLY